MRPSTGLNALAAFTALSLFPTPQSRVPDFRPLEFLVGHCWVGTFPDGKATDEHCFEWVFDQKFIRDRHVVRNGDAPYAGETLYGWDPEEKRLGFWYWNSEGEIIIGACRIDYLPNPTCDEQGYRGAPGDLDAHWSGRLSGGAEPASRRDVEAALDDGAQAEVGCKQ